MRLGVFAFSAIIAIATGCGSTQKKSNYYEPTKRSEYSDDDNVEGDNQKPITWDEQQFGPEPNVADIIGKYRQAKNNNAFLEIDGNLVVTFNGFSLPIIPQGQTQRLVPAFPQSLKWNPNKDYYETTGVLNRGGSAPMDNAIIRIVPYTGFQAIDVSVYATLNETDRIDSTFAALTVDKNSATNLQCQNCGGGSSKPDCPTKPSCETCCCCCCCEEKCEDPRFGKKVFVYKFLKYDFRSK